MALDSAASLLFSIGADSSDAEANVERFRALLSTDLAGLASEFDDWATKVFGSFETVNGAMLATGAGLGALAVAVGAFAIDATDKYAKFVEEIDRGTKTTGIAVGDMSVLHFAAEETGTSYDSLVTGLTRFSSTIVKANEGNSQAAASFARVGITQEQVKAG
jgi:hypothetical protein